MMRTSRGLLCVLLLMAGILLTTLAEPSPAQLPTGTILGTVADQTGAVVPDVTVTATNTETGVSRLTRAGNNGTYRFPSLPVGTYTVQAEKGGFQTMIQSGLRLAVGQEAVLNFRLQVGQVADLLRT